MNAEIAWMKKKLAKTLPNYIWLQYESSLWVFFWFGHLVYWLYAFKCAQCTFGDKLNLNSISSFQSKPLHDSSAFLFQRMFAHVPALPKYMHISVHVRSLNSQSHFKNYMALFKSLSKLTNELIELK